VPWNIRIWEKKRGDRSTGSPILGRVGETLFYAILFLLGSVSLAALLTSQAIKPDPRLFTFNYGFYLMVIVLTSFMLIGGAGLVYALLEAGVSVERRSAMARKAATLELLKEARTAPENYPTIPSDANLTNSPGVKLAYRLPCLESPAWRLLISALCCAVWSGVAGVLVVIAINSHRSGQPQWLLSLFATLFVAGGLLFVHSFFRQLLIHTMLGPTSVEISAHPLRPGGRYQLFLSQGGRLQMNRLRVYLVCREEATYRQGTDIRIEQHTVQRKTLASRDGVRISPANRFEHECELRIPDEAMHSFVSRNNAIHWRLLVQGEAESWPAFERSYPVIVYPPEPIVAGPQG
jgi:hypothetical protein